MSATDGSYSGGIKNGSFVKSSASGTDAKDAPLCKAGDILAVNCAVAHTTWFPSIAGVDLVRCACCQV